ncbi:MAG: putative 2-aminoethylphosphonate ABC transporter ATP-binding protein, partial [Gammaproteobacteria bacterium]|nr:putative 2-aminoethylphosphonate ABC transporter ATP-binding protein [Gammaproteobacteria bacterium]
IEDMEFLGSFWRVSLKNSALGGANLIADLSINATRRLEADTGSTIRVKLPADRLWIFPPAGSA